MYRAALVVSFAVSLAACQGDPVDCIIDSDCLEGQYCVATRCAQPTPVPDLREAYRTQLAPIIETGCNCHGPGSGRPYSFEHQFGDLASFDADLGLLALWLYDPGASGAADAPPSQPAAWGYGLAGCGFNHPGIYDGPTQPQFMLLTAWAAQAVGQLPESPPADRLPPPDQPANDEPLPALEQGALDRITGSAYAEGMAQEIAPRIIGQCGCCHIKGGGRGFVLNIGSDLTEADRAANYRSIEQWSNRLRPDTSALLRYGLGERTHPIIYSSIDDPRYRLLRAWMLEGPAAPPLMPQ